MPYRTMISCLVCVLVLLLGTKEPRAEEEQDVRYVQSTSLNVRKAARSNAVPVCKLPIAAEVKIQEVKEEWSRILGPDNCAGWVKSSFLGEKASTMAEMRVGLKQALASEPRDRDRILQFAARIAALGNESDVKEMYTLCIELKGGDKCTFFRDHLVLKIDPMGIEWVWIPGGSFVMGCALNDCEGFEKPPHRVIVNPFQMMKSEVTVGMYRRCVENAECYPNDDDQCNWDQSGREDHPINCVGYYSAKEYCEYVGGRLPSESEWEYAARGTDGRIYPWGNERASCRYAVMSEGGSYADMSNGCGREDTWPVCQKAAGNSPFGLCDMAGNV